MYEGPYAAVAIEQSVDRSLDYAVPPRFASVVQIGQRVRVPLGRNNRPTFGYVVDIRPTTDFHDPAKIKPLLAGLGIGGIAVALAVQTLLSDLLASVSIALDKPFAVGDALQVDEFNGTVEHISVRSTRLRSLTGEQIIIANGDIAASIRSTMYPSIRNSSSFTRTTATVCSAGRIARTAPYPVLAPGMPIA